MNTRLHETEQSVMWLTVDPCRRRNTPPPILTPTMEYIWKQKPDDIVSIMTILNKDTVLYELLEYFLLLNK